MTNDPTPGPPPDFSLVLGGPLYQLWRRTRLADDSLRLVHRRILVLVLVTWAPLLVLSILEGNSWGGGGSTSKLTFLSDIEAHARLLLALPLLILAELVVHQRMRLIVGQFLSNGLLPDSARPQFDAALASAQRLRNSILAEVLLIVSVYCIMFFVWRTNLVLDVASWYLPQQGQRQPSLAGLWLGVVSLPLFQFLLVRWFFRVLLWTRFLWRVSRIDLRFVPTHPDRSGGAGFLSSVGPAFSLVALALGCVLAGMLANRILYAGAKLPAFSIELAGLGGFVVLVIFGPLLVFVPKLAAAKRAGMQEYGGLAQRYVREFDDKWLRGGAPATESLIGSADIQSLADMSSSYEVVTEMRPLPFTLKNVLQLVVITLLPVAPLLLTMIPLNELLLRLIKVLF